MWLEKWRNVSYKDKIKSLQNVPCDRSLKIATGFKFMLNKDADVDAEIDMICDDAPSDYTADNGKMKDNPQ